MNNHFLKLWKLLSMICWLQLAAGCSDSSFNSTGQMGAKPNNADDRQELTSDGDANTDLGNSADSISELGDTEENADELRLDDVLELPDGETIAECLAEWGDTPFTLSQVKRHRRLEAEATMLGNTNVVDSRVTDEPELVVVKVASSTLGSATVILKNPNAWYCFELAGQSLGSTKVTAHCDSQIANYTSSSGTLGTSQMSTSCDI